MPYLYQSSSKGFFKSTARNTTRIEIVRSYFLPASYKNQIFEVSISYLNKANQ